jgi:hypothetical protein
LLAQPITKPAFDCMVGIPHKKPHAVALANPEASTRMQRIRAHYSGALDPNDFQKSKRH